VALDKNKTTEGFKDFLQGKEGGREERKGKRHYTCE